MKTIWLIQFLALYSVGSLAEETTLDWKNGYKAGEFYGVTFGQLVGTIYGVSISSQDGTYCLEGNEETNLIAIKKALEENAISSKLGYLPNKNNSLAFLRTHFPCK